MKELYLVRHAKSSWEYDGVDDYDRPLKGRGISDAHFISNLLAQQNTTPQALFSSPATRAVHTAMIFARNLNFPFSSIRLSEDLYMCSENQLLAFIRTIEDTYNSVLIFGHNPTLTNFVNRCTPQRIDNLPTTGVACFHFDINSWREAEFTAELALLDYPKKHRKKS
jgi:phosphohistidine phosphatase